MSQVLPKAPLPGTPTKDGLLFLNRDVYLTAFAPDVPMNERVVMADSQVPLALSTFRTPITNAAWKTKPSWYLVSKDDRMIPPDAERTYAKRMKATTKEISGSHAAFNSHPDVAAHLIEEAAKGAGATN